MSAADQTIQSAVNLYAKSLRSPRLLLDLFPKPRSQGAPAKRFRAINPAVVQSVTAAFETFAEELVVIALIRSGETWAQIAKAANLTNPTLAELCDTLKRSLGIEVKPPVDEGGNEIEWYMWKQTSKSGWFTKLRTWDQLLVDSEGWMQVRHCLTHGLVAGIEPAKWPGPVTGKAFANRGSLPTASSVLARASEGRKALTFYPAVNCALTYSIGGAEIARQVAKAFSESVCVDELLVFGDV